MGTPNGLPSVGWFEWGADSNYGQTTAATDLGSGNSVVRISAALTGLSPGAAYSCRLVVSNTAGVAYGAEQRFTTGRRVALWGGNFLPPLGLSNVVAIAGCGAHYVTVSNFLALKNDGTVVGWGANTYGQSTVPVGLSNVVAVSSGFLESLALKADGTVAAWGNNATVPAGLSNVVAIAAGLGQNLALRSDGTVVGWGDNAFGQATVPGGLSNVVEVACGGWFSLALRNDGSLVGWGFDGNGCRSFPPNLTNVVAMAAGFDDTIALLGDGTVWALGAVGIGGGSTRAYFNDALTGPGNTIAIAAWDDAAIGLGRDGVVTNWAGAVAVPPGLSNAVAVSAGWMAIVPNLAPQTAPQTLCGLPNRDLPITLAVTDYNGDPVSIRITSLPAAGTLYQYASGARGPAITTAGTTVSDAGGRVLFAPVADTFGSPYASFSYVASDGVLESPVTTVTANILGVPYAFTRAATKVRPTTASLNGAVTANGLATTAWWEWGADSHYGQTTAATNLAGGYRVALVQAGISDLLPGGTYHFRLVVSNAAGVAYGAERVLTTGRNVTQFQGRVPAGLSNIVAIAGGGSHSLALRNDGKVAGWGNNYNGQTNVPANVSNIVAIAAGNAHSLALGENGLAYAWGDASYGQYPYPYLSQVGVADLAAGAYYTLVLLTNGTVVGFGAYNGPYNGNYGQATPPAGLSNVVAISAGVNHSLALKADGTVVGWGDNYYGQISVPAGLSNVVAIAAGSYHSLALRADGTLVTWGVTNSHPIPLPTGLSNVIAIAAGRSYNLAMTADGQVAGSVSIPASLGPAAAMAANSYDALAIANVPPTVAAGAGGGPVNADVTLALSGSDTNSDLLSFRITSLPAGGAIYQYAGGGRGAAITSPDTVVTDPQGRLVFAPVTNSFGVSTFNYLANDGQADSAPATVTVYIVCTPFAATGPCTLLNATNAMLHGIASGDGPPAVAWFDWGTNSAFGQTVGWTELGPGMDGVPIAASLPALAPGAEYHFRLVVSNAAGVVYGAEKVFTTGSPVWAWGFNSCGQGTVPVWLTNALAVAAGSEHSLALLSDGTVAGWGRNDFGQASPPSGLTNVTALAAGLAHSVALLADGTVTAWGANNYGQTNVPAGLANVIAITAGANHSLALRNDGTVVAWGLNTSGQSSVPAGLSNMVAIAAGFAHSLALKFDGTVVNWGDSVGNSSGFGNVTAIAAAGNHSLALLSNGGVSAWGYSSAYGENTVPPSLANVLAIAAGTNHSVALLRDGSVVCWGRNDLGQASPPAGMAGCLAIAGGDQHALALASATPVPFATTLAPSLVRSTGAVLNGMATPNGPGTLVWFEWGTNASFGRASDPSALPNGNSVQLVSVALTNLAPYAGYHCRLVVSNANGLARGGDQLFTTGGKVSASSSIACLQTNVPPLSGMVAVSAGGGHVLSLRNDGTVQAWGTNTSGQATVPANLTSAIAVAAGGSHSLALRPDGTVAAWGRGIEGQTNVPALLGNVIAIAAGDKHSLALTADGSVVAWGYNASGQATVPAGLSNVVAIAAGANCSLALRQDGVVVAWGTLTGFYGNLIAPGSPAGLNNVVAFAAGKANTSLLKRDGTAVVWGDDYFGQTNLWVWPSNFVAVAVGDSFTLALKSDGTITRSGYLYNYSALTNLSQVVAVAAAGNYRLALVAGAVPPRAITLAPVVGPTWAALRAAVIPNAATAVGWFEWGSSGTFTQATAAFQLSATGMTSWAGATISNLAPGGIYSCRLVASNLAGIARGAEQRFTTGRKMLACGQNYYNQTNIPPGLTNVIAIGAGSAHSIALKNDGTVVAWGATYVNQAIVPPNLTGVIAIAAGYNHSLALGGDGTVTAWGDNAYGQTTVPVSASNVVAIACGQNHSLALRADGRVVAWGDNSNGQCTVPANLTDVVAIAGGSRHTVALKADGTIRVWGDNSYRQTIVPATASDIVAIAAGYFYSMALRADSTVVEWSTVPLPPSGLTNVMAIAAGSDYTLALKTDGTLVGWGNNSYGQSSSPSSVGSIVAIAAGISHSLLIGPNLPPTALAQTITGLANHDLLITPPATDPNGDLLNLRITTVPAQGQLYQFVGGARGGLITSPGVTLTDPAGRVLFVPAVNASGSPYATFLFTANDSEADSAPAQLTVNISAPITPAFVSWGPAGHGAWQLVFNGDSNTTYCVWASTNLSAWQCLGPGLQTIPGEFHFVDDATNLTQRFYRLSTDCTGP